MKFEFSTLIALNLLKRFLNFYTMTVLSPFVYWAQSKENVFIKVDLKDVKDPSVSLRNSQLQFEGKGVGAKGLHDYEFSIDFISHVDPEASSYRVLDNKIDFTLMKSEKGWWSRLTSQPQKPAWLKVDFDRWQSEDMNDDEDDDRDIRDVYPDVYDKLQKEERGYRKEDFKKAYLIIYNLFMFVAYLYIWIVLTIRYLKDGVASLPDTYSAIGGPFQFVQLLQFLEVLHPLFGYTKTNVLTAFLQVAGRNVVLFALIECEPRMQTKPVVFYLFLVWSAVEIVRYPYYVTQLCNAENAFLTWLRYTIWVPLYPLGFVCESVVILRGIVYFEETGRLSVDMPNKGNFSFHFPTFLRVYLLIFSIPIMYMLMSHMYKARVKKLGKKKSVKRK